VTATVSGPLVGECARCLEPFTSAVKVRFQELFALAVDTDLADGLDEEDSYQLDASGMLDLEPALRDAIVLELPLSPLCEDGCQGLCVECGVRLADAGPGHGHEQRGAMWAALKDYAAGAPAGDAGPDGPVLRDAGGPETTTDRARSEPGQTKEH